MFIIQATGVTGNINGRGRLSTLYLLVRTRLNQVICKSKQLFTFYKTSYERVALQFVIPAMASLL